MEDKLKIVICDDEPEGRTLLHAYVMQLTAKFIQSVDIRVYQSGSELLEKYDRQADILLLDIVLGDSNGIEIAERIRETDKRVNIVFVTNMPQYALAGYKVHAFGYLLKPLCYESFQLELSGLVSHIMSSGNTGMTIRTNNKTLVIKYERTLYIETQLRKVLLHTDSGCFLHNATISSIEGELAAVGFIRCHHSYVVNLNRVAAITHTDIEMDNGELIPVSRSRRGACLDALSRLIGGRL